MSSRLKAAGGSILPTVSLSLRCPVMLASSSPSFICLTGVATAAAEGAGAWSVVGAEAAAVGAALVLAAGFLVADLVFVLVVAAKTRVGISAVTIARTLTDR